MNNNINSLPERYSRMANTLNREAYRQQMNGKAKLSTFIPCARAVVLTAAISKNPVPVTSIIIPLAARDMCKCHPGYGEKELWKLYDDSRIDLIPEAA